MNASCWSGRIQDAGVQQSKAQFSRQNCGLIKIPAVTDLLVAMSILEVLLEVPDDRKAVLIRTSLMSGALLKQEMIFRI